MNDLDILTVDLETIPQREPLSEIQQQELDKKLKRYLERKPSEDKEEAKSLLMGTSPYLGEIIVIGLHKYSRGETDTLALTGTEREILDRFWNIVGSHKGLFVSYNGLSFDVPFTLKRSMKHSIKPTNKNFLNTKRYHKYPHYDVKEVIADWDRFAAPTLRMACDLMGVPSPKEGEVKAEDVAEVSKQPGGIKKIADYCIKDVVATYKVFKKLQDYTV